MAAAAASARVWKSVAEKALKCARDKKYMKREWRMFCPEKIEFLRCVYRSHSLRALLREQEKRANLIKLLAEDRRFLNEVLFTCLDHNRKQISPTFDEFFAFLDDGE